MRTPLKAWMRLPFSKAAAAHKIPLVLTFSPFLALMAYWSGGELGLVAAAVSLPALSLLFHMWHGSPYRRNDPVDPITQLPQTDQLIEVSRHRLAACTATHKATALFIIELSDLPALKEAYGREAAHHFLQRLTARFRALLRDGDRLFAVDETRFAVQLGLLPRFTLEEALPLASRLQAAAEEPLSFNNTPLFSGCLIGFCLNSARPQNDEAPLYYGAQLALADASKPGASTIRAFTREIEAAAERCERLKDDASRALENGEICPFFQPQISTDTNQITDFEALARWQHPELGLLTPIEFLGPIESAGLTDVLGQTMLHQSLDALRKWDAEGHHIPTVAVNFTEHELRNPALPDRINWELDRFALKPERLTVEVLEDVIAGSPEDPAARNLARLSQSGCGIDLDDFGTGHTSINALRRFTARRLKIDRSFVSGIDKNPEQQRLVAAIQTMAERLGLETLAEGIETRSEHAFLAQLGCLHVQGFAVAGPMPFAQATSWIASYKSSQPPLPSLNSREC